MYLLQPKMEAYNSKSACIKVLDVSGRRSAATIKRKIRLTLLLKMVQLYNDPIRCVAYIGPSTYVIYQMGLKLVAQQYSTAASCSFNSIEHGFTVHTTEYKFGRTTVVIAVQFILKV